MVKASTSLYAPPFADAAIMDQAVTPAIHSQPTATGATITTQATGLAARVPPKIPDTNVLTHNPNPIDEKMATTQAIHTVNSFPGSLSKGANAAIAAHTASLAMWDSQTSALVTHIGELRMGKDVGGVWIRTIGKQINVNEKFSPTYHQNINGWEIGADKAIQLHSREVNVDGMMDTAKSGLKF